MLHVAMGLWLCSREVLRFGLTAWVSELLVFLLLTFNTVLGMQLSKTGWDETTAECSVHLPAAILCSAVLMEYGSERAVVVC